MKSPKTFIYEIQIDGKCLIGCAFANFSEMSHLEITSDQKVGNRSKLKNCHQRLIFNRGLNFHFCFDEYAENWILSPFWEISFGIL